MRFKTHEEIIEEKAEKMGGLSGHTRELLRKYLEAGDRENEDRVDNNTGHDDQ
jgi:hypothetical protein